MPPAPPPDRQSGKHALAVYAATLALVALLVQLTITIPLVGHLGSALVALAFLYIPSGVARYRGEDLLDYRFTAEPVGRGLRTAALTMLLVFPLFAIGYLAFYELSCSSALAPLVPPGLCNRYGGIAALHAPELSLKLLEFCAVQLVVVALPEELFFRGMMLHLLTRRFPPRHTLGAGGVGFGWAAVLTSLAFALVHLPKEGDPRALATFFPALLFAWLRLRTGSLLASIVVHAGSNILIRLLELMAM
jgi:membrane protease YdiL (CAAX protease family)